MKKIIYTAVIATFLFTAGITHSSTCSNSSDDEPVCCSKKQPESNSNEEEPQGLIYFAPGPFNFNN